MIYYNPKVWFSFIFSLHKSDSLRQLLPTLGMIGLFAFGITYLEIEYLKIPKDSAIRNISTVHSLLGFVISLLLVFRTNSAYDRWWEGRKLWGGLVNYSRSLAAKLNAILPEEDVENRKFYRLIIPNFAFILKNHLRKTFVSEDLEYSEVFSPDYIPETQHLPNFVMSHIYKHTYQMHKNGLLDTAQLLSINTELTALAEICGACERIRNTPIPYSYGSFIKKVIFLYTLTLPIGFSFTMSYWIVPVVMFIFYVLASLEVIAEEIENPFGTDENDLPTDQIAKGIRQAVRELI